MVTSYRPDTLTEALELMHLRPMIPFAGGTDLLVRHGIRTGVAPQFDQDVLFVDAIAALQQIEACETKLVIGAGCTLTQLSCHRSVPALLRQACRQMAAPALRNRATLAGNIANASPAGDTLPALYLYDATLVLQSVSGCRRVPVTEFITGPGSTVRRSDELLTRIELPYLERPLTFYRKVGTRAANALAKLSVAGLASRDADGVLTDWRFAFGGVAPTVVRDRAIEQLLVGRRPAQVDSEAIAAQYAELLRPIDDQRSTANYRKRAALNLLKSWLQTLATPGLS